MEHTVSHLLEMAEQPGDPIPLHGAKVGALSVLGALLWTRVRAAARAGGLGALRFPAAAEMRPRVLQAFAHLDPSGTMGSECWRDYARKLERWHNARELLATLPARWESFDAELDSLLAAPERLIEALRAAGAPIRLSELGVDETTARWALANCHLMRDRFDAREVWEFLDMPVDKCVEAAMISENQRLFRANLFSRIVPTVRDIGLWGPKVKKAYQDMGVMQFAETNVEARLAADEEWALDLDAKKAKARAAAVQ